MGWKKNIVYIIFRLTHKTIDNSNFFYIFHINMNEFNPTF